MTLKHLFVIVPSLRSVGPVKGAVALCNGIEKFLPVCLVVLKTGSENQLNINPGVKVMSLATHSGWLTKRSVLINTIKRVGGRRHVACLSYCLSADAMNMTLKRYAIIVSSVRGNLPRNYRFDYGRVGTLVALLHLFSLSYFDYVVSMSGSMTSQLKKFLVRRILTIGNFIDEAALESLREKPRSNKVGPIRLLFLGSFSPRKRPDLLIDAVNCLRDKGIHYHVDFVGEGPLRNMLEFLARSKSMESLVTFYGFLDEPYRQIQNADCLVLPSESEGIPRVGLEALFFGVPCILRDVDANRDLIRHGVNGFLFEHDDDLVDVLARASQFLTDKKNNDRPNLLPNRFRQEPNIRRLFEILQKC